MDPAELGLRSTLPAWLRQRRLQRWPRLSRVSPLETA